MMNNNGFSLYGTLTNQDINLTFTPPINLYSFEYTVYKNGGIYIKGTGSNNPIGFNFTATGTYTVIVTMTDITGHNTVTSPQYIVDKESPIITVSKDNIQIEEGKSLNALSNIVVTDNYDKDLSKEVTTNYDELDFATIGEKKLIYSVSDKAGNNTSKTIYVNVVNSVDPYVVFIQCGIVIGLIIFIIAILKYRHSVKIENRIAKFSVESLEDDQISLFDKLSLVLTKYIKKGSNLFDKSAFLKNYSKHFEKYTSLYNSELTSMDLVSIKITFGLIFVLVCILSLAIKSRVLPVYEWIIPFFAGIFIVDIYYIIKYKFYRSKIENDLLQAIIIMNNAFKSGRSISQAIDLVTTELEGPIAKEFKKIYVELSFGLDLNTVFKRFADRVNVEEASYLTASLTILNKTGGNIVKVFDAIEKSLFSKKKLKLELNALTSSSKVIKNILSIVPLIFFLLISFIDSNYFTVFFNTQIGIILFILILILYVSYILVVNKIMKVRM